MPSVMQRVGTPNARHNLENEYRKHLENVNPELSRYNETVRQKSVEDIYAEHLQPAFEKFNEKQKRRDRRLDVKYDCDTFLGYQRALDKLARASQNSIDQKGRPPIREIVWQFGNPEQGYGSAGQTNESRERIKGMLLEVQQEAERRYPQFVWGDLVFHADEESLDADGKECGSLHLHSSFVPLCFQNKQGPEVQVAFERCLREMGFSTFEAWKHDLDKIMEDVLQKHGLERTVMDNHNEHQDSREFHRQQKLIKQTKELEAEVKDLQEEAQIAESVRDTYQEIADTYREEVDTAHTELLEARESLESAKQEISSLQADKTALRGEIEGMEAQKEKIQQTTIQAYKVLKEQTPKVAALKTERDEIAKTLPEMRQQKAEMERELPVLQEQISEAKSELAVVESAIKRKMDEGAGQFGWDGMAERIERARKEADQANKVKALEKRLSLFEQFVSLPQVRPLWEQFQNLLRRDKTRRTDRDSR